MCEFCEKEKTLIEDTAININMIHWTAMVKASDLSNYEYTNGVFIDTRGYLRLVDIDDCNCLDNGKKIKISFCPMCGKSME